MTCPSCGHANSDDARFCNECGAAQSAACASCGTENPPGAKFCSQCGATLGAAPAAERAPADYTPKHLADKILQSKSALEGERKQVTVLFADVKGSMELAEGLDPEEWHRILDRFFQILTAGVHRFEGTVNQYTGDGIMALFGAPIAHEDHAHRACYAALHLRDRLRAYSDDLRIGRGVNFSFRMGLNAGDVIVGKIGDDLRMDYTAQGHTVGLAQRMEQLAPADGIVISDDVHSLVQGFFETRALGPARVTGSSEPVEVFVLEGVGAHRTRLDTSRARGLTRFIGRQAELDALEGALQSALGGTGRVAAIIGEPGVGKSRLCLEFLDKCRTQGLAVYEAHCPAHGRAIPYLPLLELLRDLFGIDEQDGPREARKKVAGELALLDDSFADDRDLVLDFLGIADPNSAAPELEAKSRQRKLFAFIRRLIQLRSEVEPIVLLIDDLHWIDPGSDRFLSEIVEAVNGTRSLLVVNFRPEYGADWTHRSWVLQLPMAPLAEDELAELVRDWVGTAPSVAELPAIIGARSGGNPFFAEEIVQYLLETGALRGRRGGYELVTSVKAVEVPPTVRALLASRIDRLGEREKRLLYTAAVIGKQFARPLLESVVSLPPLALDAALGALLAAELIHERTLYPVTEYGFKHPLTHEVALLAQLSDARRPRHARVAEAIEELHADHVDKHAALLAHHWTEAGDGLRAGRWHTRAARHVRGSDLQASGRHWSKARSLLIALPESSERNGLLLDVYPELIDSLDRLGAETSESEAVFGEALTLAQESKDRRAEARIEGIYGWLETGKGDWPNATKHARRAVTLADAENDRPLQLFARFVLGRTLTWRAPHHEGVAVFDEAAAIGEGEAAVEILGWRPYVEALAIRAALRSFMGHPQEGVAFMNRLPSLLRDQHVDPSSTLSDQIWTGLILGDAPRALGWAAQALEAADRYGAERNRVYALLASGMASAIAERWNDGIDFLRAARILIDITGAGTEWEIVLDGPEALCRAHVGDLDGAVALAERGTRETRAQGVPCIEQVEGVYRCRVLRMAEKREALEAQIADSFELIERLGGEGYRPLILLERSGLHRMNGDTEAAAGDLAQARALFAKMGVSGWNAYATSLEA